MQPTRQGRIQILTADEIDELHRRPKFSQTEREEYFSLDDKLLEFIQTLGKIETASILSCSWGISEQNPLYPRSI